MKQLLSLLLITCISLSGCAQNNTNKQEPKSDARIGGPCEGCEAIYESPVAHEKLGNTCWLPDWNEQGTRLAVNGIVYKTDGSPAPNVIIYIYHTDQSGIYPKKGDEKGWAKRHGYLRGWMRTNEKGEYAFFTLRPGSYPESKNPAHIHVFIKEPDKNEYWIDDYLFDDDPFLTAAQRKYNRGYGGDGVLKTKDEGNMLKAERHIYLGKNILNYKVP